MRSSFARESITRLRYPTRRDHGNVVADYTGTPDRATVTRCWLEPTVSTENNTSRSAVSTGYTIDAPPSADIVAADHIEYRGLEYEVDGEPQHVPSPTGALTSTRLTVKRWEG